MSRVRFGYVNEIKKYGIQYDNSRFLTTDNCLINILNHEVSRTKVPVEIKNFLRELKNARMRIESVTYKKSKQFVNDADKAYENALSKVNVKLSNDEVEKKVKEELNKRKGYSKWGVYNPMCKVLNNKIIISVRHEYLDLNNIEFYGNSYEYLNSFLTIKNEQYIFKKAYKNDSEFKFILNECRKKLKDVNLNNHKYLDLIQIENNVLIYEKKFIIKMPSDLSYNKIKNLVDTM